MSETPVSQVAEKPRQPVTRSMKLRAAIILSALAATPVVGGFVGYEIGKSSANASRGGDIAAAKQDKNCIKLESEYAKPGNTVVLRLGALTAPQQTECGVSWVGDNTDSTYPYSDASTPQGTIVKSGIEVRLPSVRSLEGDIQHQYAQVTDPYSTFNKIGDSTLGALVGGATGLFSIIGIGNLIERRRNSASPPPASAEVAS